MPPDGTHAAHRFHSYFQPPTPNPPISIENTPKSYPHSSPYDQSRKSNPNRSAPNSNLPHRPTDLPTTRERSEHPTSNPRREQREGHPTHSINTDRPVDVQLHAFGEESLILRVGCRLSDPEHHDQCIDQLNRAIYDNLDSEFVLGPPM